MPVKFKTIKNVNIKHISKFYAPRPNETNVSSARAGIQLRHEA